MAFHSVTGDPGASRPVACGLSGAWQTTGRACRALHRCRGPGVDVGVTPTHVPVATPSRKGAWETCSTWALSRRRTWALVTTRPSLPCPLPLMLVTSTTWDPTHRLSQDPWERGLGIWIMKDTPGDVAGAHTSVWREELPGQWAWPPPWCSLIIIIIVVYCVHTR